VPAAPRYAGAAGIVTAAGFNAVRELAPYRERHVCVPFERRLDDQRARWLRREASGRAIGIGGGSPP
jgi:predicted glycosyltransferase